MLAELCQNWRERWDEYVSPSFWAKRTLADPSNLSSTCCLAARPSCFYCMAVG